MLLTTFLLSGLSGIYLIIQINYGFKISFPFNILFWHVEMGIAMATIGVFHILWHWKYFKLIFIRPLDK